MRFSAAIPTDKILFGASAAPGRIQEGHELIWAVVDRLDGRAYGEMSEDGVRLLYAKPRIIVDLDADEEYEEKAAQWWELFLDLMYVAAASNLADALKDELDREGALAYVLMFSIFFNGWLFYTLHQTRFVANSMFHLGLFYVFMLGTALMVVNCSAFEFAHGFSAACIIQRVALLLLYADTYAHVPRARMALTIWIQIISVAVVGFILALVLDSAKAYKLIWTGTVLLDAYFHLHHHLFRMPEEHRVPLNIDHCAERFSCMLLVILGESIVSCVINYRDLPQDARSYTYYAVMALTLLMVFALALIYYMLLPPRAIHAMRRSVVTGSAFVLMHQIMLCALLGMGVGVKFVMIAVTDDAIDVLTIPEMLLLFVCLSIAMLSFFVIRLLHFWGRQPTPKDEPKVRKLKYAWWALVGVWWLIPLIFAVAGAMLKHQMKLRIEPFPCMLLACGTIFIYSFLETILAHVLVHVSEDGLGMNSQHGAIQFKRSIRASTDQDQLCPASYGSFPPTQSDS
ncbi:hypothetical protein FVE85_8763 [Porphyridium purpureum]|uniref:Uncharacterized protein n=1 Tax=Porphyridium purpureum TaxID=35688 RepID=A0A5J4YPT7_PORPP|nr:hypothetical protein FVE85_8763 [Porphyridium purpureum]|eukprot:POR2257..scf296_7